MVSTHFRWYIKINKHVRICVTVSKNNSVMINEASMHTVHHFHQHHFFFIISTYFMRVLPTIQFVVFINNITGLQCALNTPFMQLPHYHSNNAITFVLILQSCNIVLQLVSLITNITGMQCTLTSFKQATTTRPSFPLATPVGWLCIFTLWELQTSNMDLRITVQGHATDVLV